MRMIADLIDRMDYLHPWNLGTLAIGIGLLVVGSYYYEAIDWDIPVSLIMAGFSYLTASWSFQVMLRREWHNFPWMVLLTWWTVDGCYAVYWSVVNPIALELMREANWPASLALYWACGLVWSTPTMWRQWRRNLRGSGNEQS